MSQRIASPTVSIIIPAYNSARFLETTIGSILEQTFQDFEVVVVDDGSTDDTPDVLRTIGDTRVRVIRQENHGLAGARNSGLAAAHGQYIAFLDADDTFLPRKLEWQVQALEADQDLGLTAGGWRYIDLAGRTLAEVHPWRADPRLDLTAWLLECRFVVHAALVRRSWLKRVHGFDPNFRRGEDWDFWLRLAFAGCRMRWLEEVVCCYRLYGSNMTRDAVNQTRAQVTMLDKFFSTPGLPDAIRDLESAAYAQVYLRGAPLEYGAGQAKQAAADLERAVALDPELLTIRREELLERVVAHALHPFTIDALKYVDSVFNQLPPAAACFASHRREAALRVALARMFGAHQAGDHAAARLWMMRAVALRPSAACRRGVLSVAADAFLGGAVARRIRRCLRALDQFGNWIRLAPSGPFTS